MKICSIASGSSGNCVYVETKKTKILVDAGLSGKRIQDNLEKIDVKTSEIDMIFVTHEHADHVKGVGVLSRRFNIPIYANEKTWLAMREKIGKIKGENIRLLKTNEFMNIKDFDLMPFSIFHDASDPIGYSFYQDDEKISIMTDTGKYNENMLYEIKDSDVYYIEANHDLEMLRKGPYPIHLQERIRSDRGHLSNIDTGDILADLLRGNGEKVILRHLSKDNNDPELAKFTIESILKENGLDTDKYVSINVADRNDPSGIIDLNKNR